MSSQYQDTYNTRRLSEVLQAWIEGKPSEVSWETVISVVENPPVENKTVAEAIVMFLTSADAQYKYCYSGQPGML